MEKIEKTAQKSEKISNFLLNLGFSYNNINKILRNKDVRIDSIKIGSDIEVCEGQKITVFCKSLPKDKFERVFEDENVLVINKFSGIEVEGEDGLEGKTGAIAVHRLDRNTEGLLIMAKNREAERLLSSAIKKKAFTKKYLAEVVGKTTFKGEKKAAFLVKDAKTARVKIFNNYVKDAVKIETIFKTIKNGNETSIVEATLITGKTHQIRAHLAFLGHPIVGDGKYGKNEDNKKFKEKNQKLHCYYLKINGLEGVLAYLNGRSFVCLPEWASGLKI